MNDIKIIDLTPDNITDYGVCGYKDAKKHVELRRKVEWFGIYYPRGLRIKALITKKGGYQGMLEYIPGRFAHRPVDAEGYMFIHCIFVGFKNEFKKKGYASSLIDQCIDDARDKEMTGVAVGTRKGPFMAGSELFLKKGFKAVDSTSPDFNLLAIKFDEGSKDPGFKPGITDSLQKYSRGLYVLRSPQCPYTEKNVNAILDSAKDKFGLDAYLVDLNDSNDAQNAP